MFLEQILDKRKKLQRLMNLPQILTEDIVNIPDKKCEKKGEQWNQGDGFKYWKISQS